MREWSHDTGIIGITKKFTSLDSLVYIIKIKAKLDSDQLSQSCHICTLYLKMTLHIHIAYTPILHFPGELARQLHFSEACAAVTMPTMLPILREAIRSNQAVAEHIKVEFMHIHKQLEDQL